MTIGDVVSFDAVAMHREHTVRNLAITSAEVDTDTVNGQTDPGAAVLVWPHGEDWATQTLSAEDAGGWLADFRGIGFDLAIGQARADRRRRWQCYGGRLDRAYTSIVVFPDWDYLEGWDWPEGELVYLTIDDTDSPSRMTSWLRRPRATLNGTRSARGQRSALATRMM